MYKLISFDIDGTLFSYDPHAYGISKATVSLLERLQSAGYILVVNTGRCWRDIPATIAPYFTYFILNNGGVLCNAKGETLSAIPIDSKTVQRFFQTCERMSKSFILKTKYQSYYYCNDGPYPPYLFYDNGVNFQYVAADLTTDAVYTLCMELEEEELPQWRQSFPDLVFVHGGYRYYEINACTADKGNALFVLLEALQIKPKETIAFGDGMNDYAVLRSVGIGAAMKNGHPYLLRELEVICDSVTENGIEKLLVNLGILEGMLFKEAVHQTR